MSQKDDDKRPIIIKKIKKAAPHGSHGGSWKIAYADFVTAMMAFFMLMWLINVTSEEQRKGIADYFVPNIINMKSRNGAGGMMGGINVSNPNNSNGKGTEPSPVEKPEEVVVEDVTTNMMSEEDKKVTESPEAAHKNGASESSIADDLKAMSKQAKTPPHMMKDTLPNVEQAEQNTMASLQKNMDGQNQMKSTQSQADVANQKAPITAPMRDIKKGQDQGQSDTSHHDNGESVAKGEGKDFGQKNKENTDKGEKKPSDDHAFNNKEQGHDQSIESNMTNSSQTQNKSEVARSQNISNPTLAGQKLQSMIDNGNQLAEGNQHMQGQAEHHGKRQMQARQQSFVLPEGENNPSQFSMDPNNVDMGKENAAGKNTIRGSKPNQAEKSGINQPSAIVAGNLHANGHEAALVRQKNDKQVQSDKSLSELNTEKNIQDADQKTRATGQSGGREGRLSETQKDLKKKEENQNLQKASKISPSKIQEHPMDKVDNQAHSSSDDKNKPADTVAQEAKKFNQVIKEEMARAEKRMASMAYHRSILYGMSHQTKKAIAIANAQRAATEKQADETQKKAQKQLQAEEDKHMRDTMRELIATVATNPDYKGLMPNLQTEVRPEGLRIQLIDQDKSSMFPSGSAKMLTKTKKLLALIAKLISPLANPLVISGHTDAQPFVNSRRYSNWELSADRANATRRVLNDYGIGGDRFESVMGKEATDPLLPDDPTAAPNRRISITLLRLHGEMDDPAFGDLTNQDIPKPLKEEAKIAEQGVLPKIHPAVSVPVHLHATFPPEPPVHSMATQAAPPHIASHVVSRVMPPVVPPVTPPVVDKGLTAKVAAPSSVPLVVPESKPIMAVPSQDILPVQSSIQPVSSSGIISHKVPLLEQPNMSLIRK